MAKYALGGYKVHQGFIEMKDGEIFMFEYCETSCIDDWFLAGKIPPEKYIITVGRTVNAGGPLIEIEVAKIRSFWGEDLL